MTNDTNESEVNEQTEADLSQADEFSDQTDAESIEPQVQEEPQQRLQPPTPEAKLLQIPSSSMKRIKEEERQRGRTAAITERELEAKKLGFRSYEEMTRYVAQQRTKAKAAQTASAQTVSEGETRESPRKLNAMEREVARLTDERKRQNRRIADLEKENKRLKTQLDAKDAESSLRVAAARNGVRDVEYALHVCRAACANKTEAELASFDEDAFFGEQLRETHPYLYKVEDRPATTAPAATAPQARPAVPAANREQSPNAGPVDATKLSPEAYKQLLKDRGIADPLVNAYAG